jgi:O-antigen/teichoic acid export membrane protein
VTESLDTPASVSQTGDASRWRSSRIGRNSAFNVAGAVVPLILSLATVPAYIHRVGEDRYGVLAVVWVVLGYFGVFDLGLSRATANQIARMRDEPAASRAQVFWTALSVNATVGSLGGVVLFFVGRVLLEHLIKVSAVLRPEAIAALPWLALAVPLTTVTLVLVGTLEGREQFLRVNLVTTFGLILFQLVPLAYAYWVSPGLAGLIMSATLALLTSVVVVFAVTAVSLPVRRPSVDTSRLGALLRYGGWVTITGLISPLLWVFDRVIVGGVLGAQAVTRYVVPFALVTRTQILPSGVARTLFPRFSMLDSTADAALVARESLSVLAVVMTVVTVIGAVAIDPFLRLWIGTNIASSSAPVGEILLMGMWLNSLAFVPFVFLQARGRPDLPAKFHVLEIAPYIGGLVLGLHVAGIRGAAWAWSGRAAVDAVLLFWATRRLSKGTEPAPWDQLLWGGLLVTCAGIASLTVFGTASARLAIGGVLIGLTLLWAWFSAPARFRSFVLQLPDYSRSRG